MYSGDGHPLTVRQLEDQLHKIVNASSKQETAVGILTSDARNSWGKAYQELSKGMFTAFIYLHIDTDNVNYINYLVFIDYTNRQSFKSIQRSIFMLCLDNPVPATTDNNWRSNLALRVLHGGTDGANSGNRWYDKTLQFVVCKYICVGIIYFLWQ